VRLALGKDRLGLAELSEQQAHAKSSLLGSTCQQAVMPNAWEPFGQDMEEPAPQELMRVQLQNADLVGVTAGPSKQDIALRVVANQALGGEGAALYISGEITKGGDSATHMLELDIPCLGRTKRTQRFLWQRSIQLGVVGFERTLDSTSEPCGERLIVNKEVVFARMMELVVFGIEGHGGDNAMDMGMMLHLPSPSMEHADTAGSTSLGFGGDDINQGGSTLTQQEVVEFFGVSKAGDAELGRDGEGDQEVGDREKLGFLLGAPNLLVGGSALRAASVVATVIGEVGALTVSTSVESSAEFGSSARKSAPHRSVMSGV